MTKQILTTITLMLSLFTYTVAQNRAPREALERLRDIGVVVKYGRIDGLKEATPIVLQRLQTRAEDTLSEAGIPVLKRVNEAYLVNRPRLILTITEVNPRGIWSVIRVESRLYERVRLLSDASKEMDLATWVQSGVGSAQRATEEMLFQVFDGQLNQFIREHQAVNPKLIQPIYAIPNPPTKLKDANSLQGVNAIDLFVTFRPEYYSPNPVQRPELQKKLQEEATSKLVQAGIPVPKYWSKPDRLPLLYVYIILGSRSNYQSYGSPPIFVESEFWQEVRHLRDLGKRTLAVTWESRASDGGQITDDEVRKVMNSQLDEFIKAYSAANPKLSPVPNAKAQ
jgi:hypothetical protein